MDDKDTQMLMPLDGGGKIVGVEQQCNSDIEEMIDGLALCLD